MKYPLLLLSLSLTIPVFGQQANTFTNKTQAENKTDANGLKEGKWIEYFGEENDVVVKTDKAHALGYTLTVYKAGNVLGAQQFYMDGKLVTEIIHGGKGQKIYRYYYESGKLLLEIPYLNSAINGTEKEYYESGKLKREVVYANGVAGVTKNYDEN